MQEVDRFWLVRATLYQYFSILEESKLRKKELSAALSTIFKKDCTAVRRMNLSWEQSHRLFNQMFSLVVAKHRNLDKIREEIWFFWWAYNCSDTKTALKLERDAGITNRLAKRLLKASLGSFLKTYKIREGEDDAPVVIRPFGGLPKLIDLSAAISSGTLNFSRMCFDPKVIENVTIRGVFKSCTFKGISFCKVTFNCVFIDCVFEGCRFEQCDISKGSIKEKEPTLGSNVFNHVTFKKVNFIGNSTFDGSIINSSFTDCLFADFNFKSNATIFSTEYIDCNFSNVTFGSNAKLKVIEFTNCKINNMQCTEALLLNVAFSSTRPDCIITDLFFNKSYLCFLSFKGIDITKLRIADSYVVFMEIYGATLHHCTLEASRFSTLTIKDTNASDCFIARAIRLSKSKIESCKFSGASFIGNSVMTDTSLIDLDARAADFSGLHIEGGGIFASNLSNTNLDRVCLSNARIYLTNFIGVVNATTFRILPNCKFRSVTIDSMGASIFPSERDSLAITSPKAVNSGSPTTSLRLWSAALSSPRGKCASSGSLAALKHPTDPIEELSRLRGARALFEASTDDEYSVIVIPIIGRRISEIEDQLVASDVSSPAVRGPSV